MKAELCSWNLFHWVPLLFRTAAMTRPVEKGKSSNKRNQIMRTPPLIIITSSLCLGEVIGYYWVKTRSQKCCCSFLAD